ncbi:sarcosine oxidase subunit gamma [Methylopila musalis]|uniref:Sarcosine oxidase subunit gamma n=1 Tax=Methylopila musalis TaxID=1134781 RepID=A0ABW3Z5R0_9HYPH
MAEPIVARSALRPHVAPLASPAGASGVTLVEVENMSLAALAAFKGREAELTDAVRAAFGVELADGPKRVTANGVSFLGTGPGKWLAIGPAGTDFSTLPAAVTDQSDGRSVFRLSGPKARETLATLVQIDLHPRAFGPGAAAATHAASIAVQVSQIDDAPTYEIVCFRTFAATLWRWILEAGLSREISARHAG